MKKKPKRKSRRMKLGIGILCVGLSAILAAVWLMAVNSGTEARTHQISKRTTRILAQRIEKNKTADNETPPPADAPVAPPNTPPPQFIEVDGQLYIGTLSIPSLSLELPINNECTEATLVGGPCRYVGDLGTSIVISGHNYKKQFGKLPALSYGDAVVITDAAGAEHPYVVELITTLHETDIDTMIHSPYDLTLFTCTLDHINRVTVRCTKARPAGADSPGLEYMSGAPKAPNYKIDYQKETLRLKKGDLYSLDGGRGFTEVTQTGGLYLDVSDCITDGTSLYVRKAATRKKPPSQAQIIAPAARAALDGPVTLNPANGRLKLDARYEIYDPSAKRWRGTLPKVTANRDFSIRVKSTLKAGGRGGQAASQTGTLKITCGDYTDARGKVKHGIVSAEITVP